MPHRGTRTIGTSPSTSFFRESHFSPIILTVHWKVSTYPNSRRVSIIYILQGPKSCNQQPQKFDEIEWTLILLFRKLIYQSCYSITFLGETWHWKCQINFHFSVFFFFPYSSTIRDVIIKFDIENQRNVAENRTATSIMGVVKAASGYGEDSYSELQRALQNSGGFDSSVAYGSRNNRALHI